MTGPASVRVAAVDLGASSGRVMVGEVGADELRLREVHRFPNGAVQVRGHLHWDIGMIHREMLTGLRAAGPVDGIGIDSWAVDYGLLDGSGTLLGDPFSHRDARTDGVPEQVQAKVPATDLYATTGLQQLPINTLYQLVSELPLPDEAATMLLIPDLLGFLLTGEVGAERTNASTTQLYDVRTRAWSTELAARVGVPARILPPLREPGSVIGPLLPTAAEASGQAPGTPLVAVGSHDTASAVVAVPLQPGTSAAYISSGTWSLVGVELAEPVLSEESRAANFTNEGGVDGRVRFLRNVMGLWVLSETLRAWSTEDDDLPALLAEAAAVPPFRTLVDIDDPAFLPPGDMQARIIEQCRRTGQPPPGTRPETVRCILESLALAYRRTIRLVGAVTGRPVDLVHVVGGGARNELLCRLAADACGVPLLAGPEEATALGNVLVQARALGVDLPDLAAMRGLVRRTHHLRRYEPNGEPAAWDAAEARLAPIESARSTA